MCTITIKLSELQIMSCRFKLRISYYDKTQENVEVGLTAIRNVVAR